VSRHLTRSRHVGVSGPSSVLLRADDISQTPRPALLCMARSWSRVPPKGPIHFLVIDALARTVALPDGEHPLQRLAPEAARRLRWPVRAIGPQISCMYRQFAATRSRFMTPRHSWRGPCREPLGVLRGKAQRPPRGISTPRLIAAHLASSAIVSLAPMSHRLPKIGRMR
jgi:hypothetical protein